MATSGVTGAFAAPVVVAMPNTVRVVPAMDIQCFRTAVPARATPRVRSTVTLFEEADEVRADLGQEMVETGADGELPDARWPLAGATGAGRAPVGQP